MRGDIVIYFHIIAIIQFVKYKHGAVSNSFYEFIRISKQNHECADWAHLHLEMDIISNLICNLCCFIYQVISRRNIAYVELVICRNSRA